MKRVLNKRRTGSQAEDAACRYLVSRGFHILLRNYRTRRGEIDIIARDGPTLVFVEVRSRRTVQFGRPEESVGMAKRRQILRVAREYLRDQEPVCRFDVVAVEGNVGQVDIGRIRLIRDAFREDG